MGNYAIFLLNMKEEDMTVLPERAGMVLVVSMGGLGDHAIKEFGYINDPNSFAHDETLFRKAGFRSIEITVNRKMLWMMGLSFIYKLFSFLMKENCNKIDILAGEILILKMQV